MSNTDAERKPLLLKVNPNPNRNLSRSSSSSSNNSKNNHNTTTTNNNNNNNNIRRSRTSTLDGQTDLRNNLFVAPTPNGPTTYQRLTFTSRGACLCILLCTFFERITFLGLAGNLVLFLNKAPLLWVATHAQSALLFFFGLAFIMAPVGGWLADSYFGRFKTIVMAFVLYMATYILLPFISASNVSSYDGLGLTTIPVPDKENRLPKICASSRNNTNYTEYSPFQERCAWLIFPVLVLIALADGTIKANIGPFGSDQLSGTSSSTHLSFFNWYYWSINVGSFVGVGAIAYVEQQISFHLGYLICTGFLGIALIVFITGRIFYTVRPPVGSIFSNIFKIIKEAWKRKRQRRNSQTQKNNSNGTRKPGIVSEDVNRYPIIEGKISFLDHAKHQYGGMFHNTVVNDVKKIKMILAVFTALIPYWIVYYQMQSTFLTQALHMKLSFSEISNPTNKSFPIGANKPDLVAAWFSMFDILFVIVLLPLFDRIIYPRLARAGYPFTFAKRVVVGMIFSISAMVVAGVVEMYRLKAFWPYDDKPCVNACLPQFIANTEYEAANMSVLWQIPQFALIGTSEVFTSVACLQFAVSVAPNHMKALITGLYYTFCGFGSIIGTLLLFIFSEAKFWFFNQDHGNINCRIPCSKQDPHVEKSCHMDHYFFFLGGLEVVGLLVFIYVSYKFGLNRKHPLAHNMPSRGHVPQTTSDRERHRTF